MFKNNEIVRLLKIKYPVIQAPMAGGVTTANLVSAVSNAGGLGMIGAGYMSPDQMRVLIEEIRRSAANRFGINLFVPNEFNQDADKIKASHQGLNRMREELNIPFEEINDIPDYKSAVEHFKKQVDVVLEEEIPVCSFTFGIPSKEIIHQLKEKDIILMGTATTVRESVENEKAGMDFVVVQGSEAGGHRGHFLSGTKESMVGLMSLIPQVVDHINIPVIAAGGIMDARGLMASLCLGAKGVQMGTAFLTCMESGANELHKQAILSTKEDETVLTRAFSGKAARGIKNRFILKMQESEASLPDFPIQNKLTQDIRKAAANQNNPQYMSLWSGQSPRLAKHQTVEELIQSVIGEAAKMNNKFI